MDNSQKIEKTVGFPYSAPLLLTLQTKNCNQSSAVRNIMLLTI